MALPLSNFFNRNRLQIIRNTSDSPTQQSKVKGNNNTVNQLISQQPQPTQDELEDQRHMQLVSQLRQQWLFAVGLVEGVTPARAAGLDWGQGEQDWVNSQLKARGEEWRI